MRSDPVPAGSPATALTVREIPDAVEWNALVQSFPTYDLRQGFEWGALRAALGWQPLRLAAFQGSRCTAACMILRRELPRLGALLYAPRGPLLHPAHRDGLAALLDDVRRRARRWGAIVLRSSPGLALGEDTRPSWPLAGLGFVPIPDETTTWNTPRHTQSVDLRATEAELWGRMRRRFRSYIRAAGRRGLVIEPTESEADLETFHRLLVNVARLKGLPVHDVGYYRTLFKLYRAAGAASMLVARVGGEIAGGLLGVRLGRRAYMLHASVRSELAETVKHHVAPALYWESLRRARAAGCESADFGSSGVRLTPDPSDFGWGVYHFKVGVGCAFERFVPYQDLVFRPRAYWAFRLCERRVMPTAWRLAAFVTSLRDGERPGRPRVAAALDPPEPDEAIQSGR